MNILLANLTKMVNDSGGLAKVTCSFANEMKKRGHDVSLVYSDERKGSFFYPIDKDIKTYDIRHYKGKAITFPLTYRIKREILRSFSKVKARTINNNFTEKYLLSNLKEVFDIVNPDIIISFQPAASKALLCDLGLTIPLITMSHGDPEDYFHLYPLAEIPALEKSTINQVLLPSFEEHIKNHLPNAKTITIGNAIPQFEIKANLEEDKEQYKIVFVGRLAKNHKRPHILIEAFAKIAHKHPQWIVELWGANSRKSYRLELERIIKTKGLTNKVFLKGTTDDIPNMLSEADIFAFPSAYEGFGMALAEAMSMGLPAIGFKNTVAVNELIKSGENGILVDEGVGPFAQALDELMSDKALRIKLGCAAKEDMKAYAPEKIWDQWEILCKMCVKES